MQENDATLAFYVTHDPFASYSKKHGCLFAFTVTFQIQRYLQIQQKEAAILAVQLLEGQPQPCNARGFSPIDSIARD